MSTSRHPVVLRLERHVGGDTRLLATVMGLPLVDGIFAALVIAGALETITGVLQVGLLVFSGSATLAVVLAEMSGTPRERIRTIVPVGVGLVVLAAIEAALAPTIADALVLPTFERFAGLVILTVAAKTASARIGEYLPRPAVIVILGVVASVNPSGVTVTVSVDPTLILRAVATMCVAIGFASVVALFAPTLRALLRLDRFRFGSAVALALLPFGIVGLIPGYTPLIVLALTGLLAVDPERSAERTTTTTQAGDSGSEEFSGVRNEERLPWE